MTGSADMRQFEQHREEVRRQSREWDRRFFSLMVVAWSLGGLVALTVLALVCTAIVWVWQHMG